MKSEAFCNLLRDGLGANANEILLRVLTSGKDHVQEFDGASLLKESLELAGKYCQAPPGGVVLLLLPHCAELFLLHLGLVLTGRLPAILPWPTNRVDAEKYQRNLLHQLGNLPAAQMLTLPLLARNLEAGLPFTVIGCPVPGSEQSESVFAVKVDFSSESQLPSKPNKPLPALPEDALFLQFSGGTTSEQKCVLVTAPMLVSQLERLSKTLEFTQKDVVVSWLPLYHDMGLIACFWLPLWNRAGSIHFAATDWLLDPGKLFVLASRYGGTFCWLPNFAFAYLAIQKRRIDPKLGLAGFRAWINCSEPVRESSVRAFVKAFETLGVRAEQCQASYAMAENVFAVTQTTLGQMPMRRVRMPMNGAKFEERPTYEVVDDCYVSSGRALPDVSVRIRGAGGDLCSDGVAGEIEIQGPSLFGGYWGAAGFHKHALTHEGWYGTGDYGFLHQDELYVIGRIKDVIIIAGVNVFPEDVEALVHMIRGIYAGRVVAFGIEEGQQGTQSLAVVAEMRGEFDPSIASDLENQIRRLIASVLGITARFVRVTPERWILKSTAGKISRRETRLKFQKVLQDESGAQSTKEGG